MPVFLKTCPKCGRRFEVERVGKTVTKDDANLPEEKSAVELSESGVTSGPPAVTSVEMEDVPYDKVFEDDTYSDTYKCKHCGNTWIETHEKVRDLGHVEGPEQDIG